MALGSRHDHWRLWLTKRLANWIWASEASGFIDRDPSESFCEDGAASLCVEAVIGPEAEEEGAEVGPLSLQLREGAVEVAVAIVQKEDFVGSFEMLQLAGDHNTRLGGHEFADTSVQWYGKWRCITLLYV